MFIPFFFESCETKFKKKQLRGGLNNCSEPVRIAHRESTVLTCLPTNLYQTVGSFVPVGTGTGTYACLFVTLFVSQLGQVRAS